MKPFALSLLASISLLAACKDDGPEPDDSTVVTDDTDSYDEDGDGYPSAQDCDDNDPSVNPGVAELCDGLDNDCDGEVDEDVATTYYQDTDGDGFGNEGTVVTACERPEGYAPVGGDCDDANANAYPGNVEVCDGVDNDCNGMADEEGANAETWYQDGDGDGWGSSDISVVSCDQPEGYVESDGDCDDGDTAYNPGALESDCTDPNDYNCDGSVGYDDNDSDGYAACEECNDSDAAINPASEEVCDEQDNNCDGSIDEGVTSTYYRDADGDAYGDLDYSTQECSAPTGYVADSTDCDDGVTAVNPAATEICDTIDNDCDGTVDQGAADASTWYQDGDTDSYGNGSVSTLSCTQPEGYVADATDCDDATASTNPGATEICNSVDDDCDGTVDDGATDAASWYADADGDAYGDPATSTSSCTQPSGYVSDSTDCDDTTASNNPAATEVCDSADNDCDGTIDEPDARDASTWYADADSDSFGSASSSTKACDQPSGYVSDATDCNDGSSSIFPGADEYCNSVDDDCDGSTDENDALDSKTWYQDADSDSYGNLSVSTKSCSQPTGYVSDSTDCNDTTNTANPAATEVCDSIDNDCDGTADEADAADAGTWYADSDADAYGDASKSQKACTQPTGYVSDSTDCDDGRKATNPGADEYCNSIDDDCNSVVDDSAIDGDWYATDADADGFGAEGTTAWSCSGVDNELDCDDSDASEPIVVSTTGSSTGDGSSARPYDSIQDGIDNASQCVVVEAGTYYEAIDFGGSNVSVTSVDGYASTTINGNGTGSPVVSFSSGESAGAVLDGFTLTGGEGFYETSSTSTNCTSTWTCTSYYYSYCGGGLYIDGSSPTLTNLWVYRNTLPDAAVATSGLDTYYTYSFGGGVCVVGSTVTLDGVHLAENEADQGGGLYVDETSNVSMLASWMVENLGGDGAGFEVDGGQLTLTNVAAVWNEATGDGGGGLLIDASLAATNVTLGGNDAATGSGLYISEDGGSTTATLMNLIGYGLSSTSVVDGDGSSSLVASYINVYNTTGSAYGSGVSNPTGSSGNISSNPRFTSVSDDSNYNNDTWTLLSTSPSLNTGNSAASYNDTDGTRNDMGAFGGPNGSWP